MLQKKIILNTRIRNMIIDYRKSSKKQNPLLTADYISEQIGRAKSWLSQIENGRLKSVKTNDLINVFCILKNKDMNCKEDRKKIENFLDNEIQYIMITQKHGIYDEAGNVIDFSEMLSFQSARGHLKFAGENLYKTFLDFTTLTIEEIEENLKKHIRHIYSSIIEWINRAFNDTSELFSDEISTRNLFLLIETSVNIYEGNCEYFGLNHLNIQSSDLQMLKEKLDTDYFVKNKTIVKSINEYADYEIDEVVKHFSSEEYMLWKKKKIYIGDEPFPMLVNYKSKNDIFTDNFVKYDDVNTLNGLSESQYLYIIKQIYNQFDIFYKKYKSSLAYHDDYQEEIDAYIKENEQLKKQIEQLTQQLKE